MKGNKVPPDTVLVDNPTPWRATLVARSMRTGPTVKSMGVLIGCQAAKVLEVYSNKVRSACVSAKVVSCAVCLRIESE